MNTRGLLVALMLTPALLAAEEPAAPARGFVDYAEVVAVRPLRSRNTAPAARQQCEDARAGALPTGDLRASRPALTPGAALREDLSGQQGRALASCRTVAVPESGERIDGYEVTYRYDGRSYTRRMAHDPGERLKVRVDIGIPTSP